MIKSPRPDIDFFNLSFHPIRTAFSYVKTYENQQWQEGKLMEGTSLHLDMLSTSLQYGQEAFEGMKCYRTKAGTLQFFRPYENAKRFQKSCERIQMPILPVDDFIEAISQCVIANSDFVPPYESKATLYVRPFMIGIGSNLVLAPSKSYLFGVVTQPVGLFFKSGITPSKFFITDYDRAAVNGTGDVKVGGNYAASFHPNALAKQKGYTDCLYLDPQTHTKIDEGGAANFFAIRENCFVTPKSKTILPSITKDALMRIAKDRFHLDVIETDVFINKLNAYQEAATCGTAAIISPIGQIDYNEFSVTFGDGKTVGPVTKKLYDELVGIQFGDIPAFPDWILTLK